MLNWLRDLSFLTIAGPEQRVSLGHHSLDLLEKQFEPIEFSTNLGFEMWGQATAIASLKRFQPRSSIAAQRLIAAERERRERQWGERLLPTPTRAEADAPEKRLFTVARWYRPAKPQKPGRWQGSFSEART